MQLLNRRGLNKLQVLNLISINQKITINQYISHKYVDPIDLIKLYFWISITSIIVAKLKNRSKQIFYVNHPLLTYESKTSYASNFVSRHFKSSNSDARYCKYLQNNKLSKKSFMPKKIEEQQFIWINQESKIVFDELEQFDWTYLWRISINKFSRQMNSIHILCHWSFRCN